MTTLDIAAMPGLCPCGSYRSVSHRCEYTEGRGWCLRCLAEYGDPLCCTPERMARLITVPAKACGCLLADDCRCAPVLAAGSAYIGGAR